MKVLFAGTPDFAVPALQALNKDHEIIGVYTQPDRKSGRGKKLTPSPVKVAAQALICSQAHNSEGRHPAIYQPHTLKDQAAAIEKLKPDVMVVVAYGMLLPQAILDIPRLGCINIHASLLPRWRGAAPIHRAIEAGDAESGVSIMQMELGLDTGPIFEVHRTPITKQDTTATLHDKLARLGAEGICDTLEKLVADPSIKPCPQNDALASYAKKLNKSEAVINWSLSAQEIQQKVRAFNPFPICQCLHNDTRLRIWQAEVISNAIADNPVGEVLRVGENGIDIQCGTGVIRLETLQRDGGKALAWQQFKNGYPLAKGDILT